MNQYGRYGTGRYRTVYSDYYLKRLLYSSSNSIGRYKQIPVPIFNSRYPRYGTMVPVPTGQRYFFRKTKIYIHLILSRINFGRSIEVRNKYGTGVSAVRYLGTVPLFLPLKKVRYFLYLWNFKDEACDFKSIQVGTRTYTTDGKQNLSSYSFKFSRTRPEYLCSHRHQSS